MSRSSSSSSPAAYAADVALKERYSRALFNLGAAGNDAMEGIWSPKYDISAVSQYVQSQFLKGAEEYARKYDSCDYWKSLLVQAFSSAGIASPPSVGCEPFTALDLGSGAGNTVFPLLELCPQATVVASDLSVPMLVILKRQLTVANLRSRCALLQLNAEELDFLPQSFDLVVGGAILHHLLQPERVIRGCAAILKPGGCAMFFEPFENGNAILALAYREILRRSYLPHVARRVLHKLRLSKWCAFPYGAGLFLQTFADYHALRRGRDKSAPIFRRLDDKWLFTQRFFREHAKAAGFDHCIIYPLHEVGHPFTRQTQTYLQLGAAKGHGRLPPWAWKILEEYDAALSEDLRAEMLIEGCIVLRKP